MIVGLIVCAFAAYRATRLVVFDSIVSPLHRRLEVWTYRNGIESNVGIFLIDLTNCPHCTGWWMSMITSLVWATTVESYGWFGTMIFAWAVAGLQSVVSSAVLAITKDG